MRKNIKETDRAWADVKEGGGFLGLIMGAVVFILMIYVIWVNIVRPLIVSGVSFVVNSILFVVNLIPYLVGFIVLGVAVYYAAYSGLEYARTNQ
jgi:hypothetical protein